MIFKTIPTWCSEAIDRVLLPPHCPRCRVVRTLGKNVLCAACWQSVGTIGFLACRFCGRTLYPHEASAQKCDLCLLKEDSVPCLEKSGWHQSWGLMDPHTEGAQLMTDFLNGKNPNLLPFLISCMTKGILSFCPSITHCVTLKRKDTPTSMIKLIHGISTQIQRPFFLVPHLPHKKIPFLLQGGLLIAPTWISPYTPRISRLSSPPESIATSYSLCSLMTPCSQ